MTAHQFRKALDDLGLKGATQMFIRDQLKTAIEAYKGPMTKQQLIHTYRRFRLARRLTASCINPRWYLAQLWFDIRWTLPPRA